MPGLLSALQDNSFDADTARRRAALGAFQNALAQPDVQGGLLTNEQMGQLPIAAQGLVNHTAGGNFGGLPEVPQMTPLQKEQALTAAMDNHDFNGAVARQDASGRAYFADPTEHAPVDPTALAGAEANLQDKGMIHTAQGWMPSPGRGAALHAADMKRRAGHGRFQINVPNMGQQQGGMPQPAQQGNGLLPEAQRRANVTLAAQDRADSRRVRMGVESPEAALMNQLKHRGMSNSATGAGMMFGPGAYEAHMRVQAAQQQHDEDMQQANSVQGVVNRYLANGGDPTQVGSVVDAWKQAQPGAAPNPLMANHQLDPLISAHPNSYQGYVAYMKAAASNGVPAQRADAAWKAQGRTTQQGVFSGESSNPLVNFGAWIGSQFTGVR